MRSAEERYAERRRVRFLAPLMVATNALLFVCIAGLAIVALNGGRSLGIISLGGDANQRIVKEYLAQKMSSDSYRIRQWYPAAPLEGNPAALADNQSDVQEKGVAQRVKVVFYGPSGAKQMDTIYWIQNGRVTRSLEADRIPSMLEL